MARATGQLQRAFLWGSFPTDAPFPRDLDVFLLMQTGFDREFPHLLPTQRDVFWATATIGIEERTTWLHVYQRSRDMVPRGIVEVLWDD